MTLKLVTDTCVTEKEIPAVPVAPFEVFHEGKPTGVKAETYSECLELGVTLMQQNPDWMHVKVLKDGKVYKGGVWRNPREGRLIKSKELG
jgi:hypothetical protein